jgi:hypothetical protein
MWPFRARDHFELLIGFEADALRIAARPCYLTSLYQPGHDVLNFTFTHRSTSIAYLKPRYNSRGVKLYLR